MKKSWLVIAAAIGLVLIASVAVLKTSGDDSRRQGALGTDEPVTLSWHGDWNAETQYTAGSVVTYDGASYVAEAEGEKLATPELDCAECGWTPMAIESPPEASEDASATTQAGGGITGYEIVKDDLVLPSGTSSGSKIVGCPDGKKVFGGGSHTGFVTSGGPAGPGTNYPNDGVYGWRFTARVEGGGATLYVYAVCANAS